MGLFKKFFGKKEDIVYSPENIESQIASRNAEKDSKSFFEKVSEKASGLVNGLRGMFGRKAMNVLDEEAFEKDRLGIVLDVKNTSAVLNENGDIEYTRRSNRGMPRREVSSFGSVGQSAWMKRSTNTGRSNRGGVRRTGTGSRSVAFPMSAPAMNYQVGNSKVHSLYMLKYGVDVTRIESAYLKNNEDVKSVLNRLEMRVGRNYRIAMLKLVNDCGKNLFKDGKIQGEVLNDFLEGLTEMNVSKEDIPRICVDLAKYASTIAQNDEVPFIDADVIQPIHENNNGMFDDFNNSEQLNVKAVSGISGTHKRDVKVENDFVDDILSGEVSFPEGDSDSEIISMEGYLEQISEGDGGDLNKMDVGNDLIMNMVDTERIARLEEDLAKERAAREKLEKIVDGNSERIKKVEDDVTFVIDGLMDSLDKLGSTKMFGRATNLGLKEGSEEVLLAPELPEKHTDTVSSLFRSSFVNEGSSKTGFEREDHKTEPRYSGVWKKMN